MGTPAFALPSLQALVEAGYPIKAVYSQPPRPKGRGHTVLKSPVHAWADAHGISVETPLSLRHAPQVLQTFLDYGAQGVVVAAYGLLIPQNFLDAAPLGWVNVHASLLPRWRGAAPIQRAILAGDAQTGVTLMAMTAGLDTGPMIAKASVDITPQTTTPILSKKLADLGGKLLQHHLLSYFQAPNAIPQNDQEATYAAKLQREEGHLDFSKPASQLVRCVRALTPWPGTWTFFQGKRLKVLDATFQDTAHQLPAGTVMNSNFQIACGAGMFCPQVVQLEGKQAMPIEAFVKGHPISEGHVLPQF